MEHYYTPEQSSKLTVKEIKGSFFGKDFSFSTPSAVFSHAKFDNGSRLLLESSKIKGKVLDFGCGWGFIGVVAAKCFPDVKVTMSDVNKRALNFAKKNLFKNKVRAVVVESDCFENIKDTFDVILLNPPQKAGLKLCYRMIEESKQHLNGRLNVVARHKIGGKRLMEKMQEVFGNVETLSIKSGFRVYSSLIPSKE